MQPSTNVWALLALTGTLAACYSDPMSQRGFSLPEGDAATGREVFAYMECHQCHTVSNESFAALPGAEPYVELGGDVTNVKSYGELVTSIINPSHDLAEGYAEEVVSEDSESNMYNYNQYMSVQELIDLVAFLQPHYRVIVPETRYRPYVYR
jgi:mono/diheme cytochrome c family protein